MSSQQHPNDYLDDILLYSCESKEELVQFLIEKEFEYELYSTTHPERAERLHSIMNKIFELFPELDMSVPLNRKKGLDAKG